MHNITIEYNGQIKKFSLPQKHKIEEFKHMLEDLFGFETFARRLIFRYEGKIFESIEELKIDKKQ